MKLSNKLKTKLKTRLTSAIAVLAVLVLVFACSNINIIKKEAETGVATLENSDSAAKNEIAVLKDSTGINLNISGYDENGVNTIEVYDGATLLQSYTYSDGADSHEEKLAIRIPFGETHEVTVMVNGEPTAQKNVQNMRYIYNVTDMVAFRNAVNNGNSFAGKYVELMANINLNSVCSSSLGSWNPIGSGSVRFSGMFNGNYYTISNLYYNSNVYQHAGLFFGLPASAVVQNLMISGFNITNTKSVNSMNCYAGGITGYMNGILVNCANLGGTITQSSTTCKGADDNHHTVPSAGGLIGGCGAGASLRNCYNKATIKANCSTSLSYTQSRAGGLTGNASGALLVENCYNTGSITSTGKAQNAGGITGVVGKGSVLKNSYSTGTITCSTANKGGVTSRDSGGDGNGGTTKWGTVTNCYYLSTSSDKAYRTWNTSSKAWQNVTTGSTTAANMKVDSFVTKLGGASWIKDSYSKNGGYPILRWQIPYFELSKNQVYLHENEELQLNTVTSKTSVAIGAVTWASSNPSVATVDSTGKVTAIGEGYTMIYATEATYSLKAMCAVNVAKNGCVAFPKVATSDAELNVAFSAVLKENGTVWTTGSGNYGQLGNGRMTGNNYPVQVMIDKDTPLTNVVKIAVGYAHTLALTADGRVYAWGLNNKGQLGINNTTNQAYAKPVLNYEGTEELRNIVDISAGYLSSSALDQGGLVYTWGNNSNGQLGIGNTTDKAVPQIALCSKAVRVGTGGYDMAIITVDGRIMSWGLNTNGRLGVGNTTQFTTPQTTSGSSCMDLYKAYNKMIVLAGDNLLYVCGYNDYGDYGDGTTTSATSFRKIATPGTSRIKYISGTARNVVLMMEDGTIWAAGGNTFGQLSTGGTSDSVTSYVQAKNPDGSYVTNARSIGIMGSTQGDAATSNERPHTISYVGTDGNVYLCGSNNYAQMGNGTYTNSLYYTKMGAPYLNYKKVGYTLNIGENETFNTSDFEILDQFNVNQDFQEQRISTLTFSTESDKIQVVGNKITALAEGYGKVKVEDTNTGYVTYIPVKVVNGTPTKIALGSKFSVSLRSNGEVYSWGENTFGELGQNTNEPYIDEPKQIDKLNNIKDIDTGIYHALALDESGNVYAWGLNNNGQLGNGGTSSSPDPTKIQGLSNIKKISAYKYLSLALDVDNNLYAWGEGYTGIPQKIAENIIDISEDKMLTTEHKVQFINGLPVHNLRGIYEFSANEEGLLAISNEGNAIQVYNDDTVNDFNISNAVKVSAGKGYGTILTETGDAYTYGVNESGQLGIGNTTTVTTPVKINVSNVEIIAAGEGEHSAVVDYEGSIFTTGLNDRGQLGHKNVDNKVDYEIVLNVVIESNVDKIVKQIGGTENVDVGLGITLNLKKDLTQDSETTIAIVDSTIAGLTENNDGTYTVTGRTIGRTFLNATILGNIQGETKQFAANIEVRIVPEGGITVPQLKAGKDFTVALKADGKVESWGGNQFGQLGLGNKDNFDEPQEIGQIEETIVEIAVGNSHVLALTENGTIYGWGLNDNGQVGNGTLADQVSQATVINIYGNELAKIIRVEAHEDNSFAIDEEGKVYAWGKDYGNKARKLDGLENAIDVSTNYYTKADGTVYKMQGLEQIGIVGKVRILDEGVDHAVFLTTDGTAYSIGDNTFGQLGIGNTTPVEGRVEAVRKSENEIFSNILAIEAGDKFTVILTTDGKVFTVGKNTSGVQGENPAEITNISLPKECRDLSNTMIISAGCGHVVTASNNGTAYSWGSNEVGQLGNRTIEDSKIPVMIGEYVVRSTNNHITEGIGDAYVFKAYVDYFNIIKEEIIPINVTSKNSQVASASLADGSDAQLTEEEIDKGYIGVMSAGMASGSTYITLTPRINNVANSRYAGIVNVDVIPECRLGISPDVKTISNHTVMLKSDGTVWSYGQNSYGQLGIGSDLGYVDEPTQVSFDNVFEYGVLIKQIVVGEFHTVALDTEGNVWTWGRNNYYQLGVTNVDTSSEPVLVTGIPKVTRIAAGNNSVMAITEDNKLIAWGQNAYGELGIGTVANKQTPVVIEGIHDVLDIQGGKNHYVVLKTDGRLYTVGSNLYGQLGVDLCNMSRSTTFKQINNAQKFGKISSGWTSNIAMTTDGQVFGWGQNNNGQLGTGDSAKKSTLTRIDGVSNIVDGSIGKTHTILRDFNGDIYLAGVNSNGQFGDGTTNSADTFKTNSEIDDVLRIVAGNTYTAVMKADGTVWAWGDYNHGNKTLKSTTNSKVPIQIGSNTTALDKQELVIKISEVETINYKSDFKFNLLYDDENVDLDLSFESLNNDIAMVNDNGDVLGVRPGTTWVKVINNVTGKVNAIIVRVIDNADGYQTYTAPKIEAGDGYAVSLREDGSVYIWGYDNNGMVDSDVPFNMNIVSTYIDVKSGKDHIVALRADGTVWTAGGNNYGELGLGNNRKYVRLVQVQGMTDIVKIAAGDHFSVAMDSYGIIYVWGEGYTNKPQTLNTNIRAATYIDAGDRNQIVIVQPDGTVYGLGNILNGKLEGITNAVKAEVGHDYILILDINGDVYKYSNGVLIKVDASNTVDISVNEDVNMYQNVNERAYAWGDNSNGQLGDDSLSDSAIPIVPQEYSRDVFGIAAGMNNTYIIDINGNVYAAGDNTYGQIGNGTKEDITASSHGRSVVHTLVGDRVFTVQPETAIMAENDVEELDIIGNSYNVFRSIAKRSISEYDVVTNDDTIIELQKNVDESLDGSIKAVAVGKTTVELTDKVTGQKATIERRVVPLEQKRIRSVTANGTEADVVDSSDNNLYVAGYNVEVPLDDDETQVDLIIESIAVDDQISIDGGDTYQTHTFSSIVEIPGSSVSKIIKVKTSNGTEFEYEITIVRVSKNNRIDSIKVNGFEATNSEENPTVYEIIVTDKTANEVVVTAEKNEAKVSIKGVEATLKTQSYTTALNDGYIEVPIKVTAECGLAQNYTLKIYTVDEVLKLQSVNVNGKIATVQSDESYLSVIADDVNRSTIEAISEYDDVNVQISDLLPDLNVSTRSLVTKEDETEIPITLSATLVVDGVSQSVSRQYISKINKNRAFSFVDQLTVNDEVIEEENNTYVAYVTSNINDAIIEITAGDTNYRIRFDDNNVLQNLRVIKQISQDETVYEFSVTDEGDGTKKNYILKIIRGNSDTGIKRITVGKESYVVEAELTNEVKDGKPVYVANILDKYLEADVTVQAANRYSKVNINNSYITEQKISMAVITMIEPAVEVPITIMTEDEQLSKEYILRIVKQNDNTVLESITVNDGDDIIANLEDENDPTRYVVHLTHATRAIEITGIAEHEKSSVSINGEEKQLKESSITLDLTQATTEIEVKVISEAGTEQTYYLTIYTISDDVSLQYIKVDGVNAIWNNTSKRYEIKVDRNIASYRVESMTTEDEAKITIGSTTNTCSIVKNITSEENETNVIIGVTAPNGITTSNYKLAILEKSNNAELGYVKINGKMIAPNDDGDYYLEVVSSVQSVLIQIGAQESNASISLEGESQIGVWKNSKVLQTEMETYRVYITAEDGSTQTGPYLIKIKRLDGSINISNISVSYLKGESTISTLPTKQADGTYYIKIRRPSEERVTLDIQAEKSTTEINVLGTAEKGHLVGYLNLSGDVTIAPIIVTAEDGSTYQTSIKIEKQSNNAEIQQFTALEGAITGKYQINADSKDSKLTITVIPEHPSAKVRLTGSEDEFVSRFVNLEVNTAGLDELSIDVMAEDGETIKKHTLHIMRTYRPDLQNAKYNGQTVHTGYPENVVDDANGTLVLTAVNDDAEIYLRKNGTDIATGVGTLTTEIDVGEESASAYSVLIKGPDQYVIYQKTFDLYLRAKSTDYTGTVTVDSRSPTYKEEDDEYYISVSGESHTILARATSTHGKVSIAGATASNVEQSKSINIEPGQTAVVGINFIAENGESHSTRVNIYRRSNRTTIKQVSITPIIQDVYGGDEILTAKPDGTYYKKINRYVDQLLTSVVSSDSKAKVAVNNELEAVWQSDVVVDIPLNQESVIIPIKIVAEDGTEAETTLKVERESNDVTLDKVLDGKNPAVKIDELNYKLQVDSRATKIDFTAKPKNGGAKIKLASDTTYSSTLAGVDIDIEGIDSFDIDVMAEDGETTMRYTIQIERIYDASMKELSVDDEKIKSANSMYQTFVTANQADHTIRITAENGDAIIKLLDADDNEIVSDIGVLTYVENNLNVSKMYKVVISGPDEYSIFTRQYIIALTEKSTDNSARIFIDDVELDYDEENDKYTFITSNTNNKLKVVAASSYASISVNNCVPVFGQYERNHSIQTGTTQIINVVVTSQNGEAKTYVVELIKLNNNVNIYSLKVNDIESAKISDTLYKNTQSTSAETAEVVITLDDALASVKATADGTGYEGTGSITINVPLPGAGSVPVDIEVRAQDGTTKTYKLTIVQNPSSNVNVAVKVNGQVAEQVDEATYRAYVPEEKTSAEISIATIDSHSIVEAELERGNDITFTKALRIDSDTTVVNFVVTAQSGITRACSLYIIRANNPPQLGNINIASLKVNGKEASPVNTDLYTSVQLARLRSAEVVVTLEDAQSSIKARVDGNEYAETSIVGNRRILEFTTPLAGSGEKTVLLDVTDKNNVKNTVILKIVQNTNDSSDVTVKVNSVAADQLNDTTYRIFVHNTDTLGAVNIKAEDDNTVVESLSNTTDSGNSITFDKPLNTDGDITVVTFSVITQSGIVKDCDLYIIKESTDNTIGKLYVNGIEMNKDDNGRYTAYIDNAEENPSVKVVANNEYAYVRIDSFAEAQGQSEHIITLGENRTITVPIAIRSQSGESRNEALDIVVTFVKAKIDEVLVDGDEVTSYDASTKTYVALVENGLDEHEIYVSVDNDFMTLEINEEVAQGGNITTTMTFEEGEEIRSFPLYVTGETGITEVYTIVLAQKSSDVKLKSVKVNDVSLTLDPIRNEYKKSIDMIATVAKVEVESQYRYATVKVGDNEEVYGNSGVVWVDLVDQPEIIIPVVVTAADGDTIETYNIVLTRVASEIKGKIITQNAVNEHRATIKVYRSADRRKIDDEVNPRELVTSIITNEDGTYSISVPNADEYDLIIEKEGYLTHTITNVKAKPYTSVKVKDTNIYAGNIIKYTLVTQVNSRGEYITSAEPKEIEQIELQDLVAFNDNYGETITDANWLAKHTYDLNEDGVVDRLDRNILKANMNKKDETEIWTDPDAPMLGSMMMSSAGGRRMAQTSVPSGSFIKPIACDYTVTSPYGERVHPVTGEIKKHNGIDLSGTHHTEILAIADGEVTFAGQQSGYGNCIEIKHIVNGETIYSFYAHLSRIDVSEGDSVSQGQVIGLEGGAATDPGHGTSTGHHLHFEIRTASGSGHAVNPSDYINF